MIKIDLIWFLIRYLTRFWKVHFSTRFFWQKKSSVITFCQSCDVVLGKQNWPDPTPSITGSIGLQRFVTDFPQDIYNILKMTFFCEDPSQFGMSVRFFSPMEFLTLIFNYLVHFRVWISRTVFVVRIESWSTRLISQSPIPNPSLLPVLMFPLILVFVDVFWTFAPFVFFRFHFSSLWSVGHHL